MKTLAPTSFNVLPSVMPFGELVAALKVCTPTVKKRFGNVTLVVLPVIKLPDQT